MNIKYRDCYNLSGDETDTKFATRPMTRAFGMGLRLAQSPGLIPPLRQQAQRTVRFYTNVRRQENAEDETETGNNCCVCRQTTLKRNELKYPCGHFIHEHCHGTWRVQCPIPGCRRSLVEQKFGEVDYNHPLVWEIILAFTKAAINSDRYNDILTPYPEVENAQLSIEELRQLVKEIPPVREIIKLSTQVSPRVSSFLNWTINSNRSAIMRIAKPIPFLESAHQFIFIQHAKQQHTRRFNELKKARGSLWAFHGSKPENWHSIIRNGLVNASGTKLQVNGAAHGKGIYMSPCAKVSYSYSGLNRDCNPRMVEDGISHDSFACIAICEVIDEGVIKSSNNEIWVQPNESHVTTRFLFVFDTRNVGGFSANLTDPQYISQLNTALREN